MPDEIDYLRQLELLARDVVDHAGDEGWLEYGPDPDNATPLQRSINELARALRHYHFDGDGCIDERPLLPLSGLAVIGPDSVSTDTYAKVCQTLGVVARDEGWALWHAWDEKGRPHTLVTSNLKTTQGLLQNWSYGRNLFPVKPERAQVAAVVRGWIGPATLAPAYAERIGLGASDPASCHHDTPAAGSAGPIKPETP